MNLTIFERAVQDPCSEECDCEDEDPLCEEQELDPLQELDETHCHHCKRRDKPTSAVGGLQRAVTTNSITVSSPRLTHTLTHSKTSPSPTLSRPPRSRANSTSLIRHISSTASDTDEFHSQRPGYATASRSRSSCCGIPTHLYGLEKYVSCALDALSAGDYCSHRAEPTNTNTTTTHGPVSGPTGPLSSSSSSCSSRGSVPPSDFSQSSTSTNSRMQLVKKGRKKSFIEISLSKSFSQ